MSYTKLKSLLAKLKEQRGLDLPTPKPVLVRFIAVAKDGGKPRDTGERILMRNDGTFRLPREVVERLTLELPKETDDDDE
jgi:hypothetical protein